MPAEPPDCPVLRAAMIASKSRSKRRGGDYGRYLGRAWEGAMVAAERGCANGQLVVAAKYGAIEQDRADAAGGWGSDSHAGKKRLSQHVPLDDGTCTSHAAPDHRPTETPADRLHAAWAEYRPLREGMDPRLRVMLFLYTVHGMNCAEIGAAFGVSDVIASRAIRRAKAIIESNLYRRNGGIAPDGEQGCRPTQNR